MTPPMRLSLREEEVLSFLQRIARSAASPNWIGKTPKMGISGYPFRSHVRVCVLLRLFERGGGGSYFGITRTINFFILILFFKGVYYSIYSYLFHYLPLFPRESSRLISEMRVMAVVRIPR